MAVLDTKQKIEIFKSFFNGLDHVYGTYDISTGKARQVKSPVTDQVILAHLSGKSPYGIYLLKDDKITSLAVDFDIDEICLPISFIAGAKRFGLFAYIERSKSKGYHAWMFFEEPVEAKKARLVARKILTDMGKPDTEIFPKQDSLAGNTNYGNFINAPLFGKLVVQGRSVFMEPGCPSQICKNQWKLLNRIVRIPTVRLDGIIKSCNLCCNTETLSAPQVSPENKGMTFGLTPCVQKILNHGVDSYQRVTCFRLAIALKRAGLPIDLSILLLCEWAKKNHPAKGKQLITEKEILRQTEDAYKKQYNSCGCEDPGINRFCDTKCPLWKYSK